MSATGTQKTTHPQGLEGVVACDSAICAVDGQRGVLTYFGYDIHDLADHAKFEEVIALLWDGELPTQARLDDLNRQLVAERPLPGPVMDLLHTFSKDAHPMSVLRTAVSALGMYDPEADAKEMEANHRKAIKLMARIPTIIATYDRLRKGKEPVPPTENPSTAYNFLAMLRDDEPTETEVKGLDIAFTLHADHELNASTFTARTVAATLADFYGATTAAVASLSGPLHGGANEDVVKTLDKIGGPGRAADFVRQELAAHRKLPGFGHRVYKAEDPRATHLREMARQVCEESGHMDQFETLRIMEDTMLKEKNIHCNVDFYSGTFYRALGIPDDLFTPVFAISRMSGWAAHILEQYAHNRLIRPRAEYVGAYDRHYVPIEQRG
jgi:citrate synthase